MNPQPNRFFHLSLIFLMLLNLVPHFNDHTVPVLAMGGICLSWRLLYEYQKVPLPNFFTKLGLVVVTTYLIIQNYGQLLGLESGTALLICAVALKLIDGVGYRTAMVLLFLNFMLLLARFFESQSLGMTIFAGFDLIITTALLVQLHNGSRVKFDLFSLLRTGLRLFLQVTPFMVLLFFIFPRFSTGFLEAKSRRPALDGFSDTMEPGALARLAQSEQPAFRVRFKGLPPLPNEMYWRGGILAQSLNMKWEKGNFKRVAPTHPGDLLKAAAKQEILLEPGFNEWLFTLDRGIWIEHRNEILQRKTLIAEGDVFSLNKPRSKRSMYESYSLFQKKQVWSEEKQKRYTQAPENKSDRVQTLIEQISEGQPSTKQMAYRLMRFYQNQFRYTLTPGKLKTLELEEFLFDKKVGFCEHFAVSFATLMRLAKVPARVVVGFQGGRKNDLSDYYLVTSKDAHAWTEVWSKEEKRWLRYDPTSVVAPLRVELGGTLYHSLTEEQRLNAGSAQDFLAQYEIGWLQRAYFAFDALSTQWNTFLLNFDRDGQRDFFARLGFGNIDQNLLLSLSLVILLLFFLWARRGSRQKRLTESASHKVYMDLRQFLAKNGIEKESYEGPSDFLKRVQRQRPQQKEALEQFREVYLEGYYGERDDVDQMKHLLKEIRMGARHG